MVATQPTRLFGETSERLSSVNLIEEGVSPTVLVADVHQFLRKAVAEALAAIGARVVGDARSGTEAITLCRQLRPGIVLLDAELPGMGVVQAMETLKNVSPHSKIVVTATRPDLSLSRVLLARGASAYLTKTISIQELVYAIKSVREGEIRVALSLSAEELQEDEGTREKKCPPPSERELEVLLLVARGMSNAQIGSSLYLSEGTVKRHLYNVYRKLDVNSRSAAIRSALVEGWLQVENITDSRAL